MNKREMTEVLRLPQPMTARTLNNELSMVEANYGARDLMVEADGDDLVVKTLVDVVEEDQDPKNARNTDAEGNFKSDTPAGVASKPEDEQTLQVSALTGDVVREEDQPVRRKRQARKEAE